MSFTTEIKQEIASNNIKKCCAKAELSSLIQLTSSITISNKNLGLRVRTENPTTAKRIVYLIKRLYHVETELQVQKKQTFKKHNIYRVNIYENVKKILTDLGLYGKKGLLTQPSYTIVKNQCCQKAYLSGAFLAYGTCNSPKSNNYHFEISVGEKKLAEFIVKLFKKNNFDFKIIKRRNRYVVYIKKADKIGDLLKLVGASDSLIKFENNRITRDFKTNLVRLENCEIANEIKSMNAAKEQMKNIEKIKKFDKEEFLDDRLKEIYFLRMKNSESSLNELCEAYEKQYGKTISKSGIKHRLNKIEEIANSL